MTAALRAAALLLALAVVASTATAVVLGHCVLPTWDHWVTVGFADRVVSGKAGFADFWAQHNEHRIVLPRLLFLLDFLAFAGCGRSLLVMTAIVQAAHVLVLWRLVLGASPLARVRPGLTLALIAAPLASAAQMFNLIEPFQVQFVLVHAAATAAFAAAARAAGSPGWRWWAAALAAGTVSALSMANGLLVLPALVAFAWWTRAPMTVRGGIVLAAATIVSLWLWDFERATDEVFDPTRNVRRPWRIAAYVACWVGSPLRWIDAAAQPVAGGLGGAAALAAFAALAVPIFRRGPAAAAPARALAWTGVFLVATALITAVGRSGYSNLAQAQADRYATPCHVFWIVLCALAVGHARRGVRAAGVAVAAALTALLAAQQPAYLAQCRARHERVRQAELSVLCGVRDDAALARDQIESFVPAMYDHWLATLQQRGWSVFALDESSLPGRRVSDAFRRAAVATVGATLEKLELVPGTAGHAYRVRLRVSEVDGELPRLVLLAGMDEVVVGLAARVPAPAGRAAAEPDATFAGYAVASMARPVLAVWVVLAGGRICRTPLTLPVLAEEASGRPLAGVVFRLVEAVRAGDGDAAPGGLAILDPHATTAGRFGRIDVGPLPRAGGRVGLPFRTGPCNWAMSLHLVDLGTLQPLASIDAPQTHGAWAVWQVDVPPRPGAVLGFAAADRGARPGQWIEVARPIAR